MSQLLLCSIEMQNIHIFYGDPAMFVVTCFSVLLVSQWSQHFLTWLLVFSNSKILSVLILLFSIPSINSALNYQIESQSPFWKSWCDAYQKRILLANLIILLGLLTHFNFVLVLSHYIATYNTHSLLFPYPNFDVFSAFITANDWHLGQLKKFIVVRFDDSIGRKLLGNNNESDNPYFFFMNPFLSFETRVCYSYVLIPLFFFIT